MAKPFCTCPIHGWTERIESGGPCKKCAEESAPAPAPAQGVIGSLFGFEVRVSNYLPDGVIFVTSATFQQLQEWYADIQNKKSD